VHSLYNKCSDVIDIYRSQNISVFCLTETWLSSNIRSSEFLFEGYTTHRIDRDYGNGGGLCCLVDKKVPFSIENVFCSMSLELLHVSIDFSHMKPLQVITIYRRPNASMPTFISELTNFLNNINYMNLPCILLGDFNHDLLSITHSKDSLLCTLHTYAFQPCHKLVTRKTSHSATCIDLIFANNLAFSLVNNIASHHVGFSDHMLLLFNYKKARNVKIPKLHKNVTIYSKTSIADFAKKCSESTEDFSTLPQILTFTKNLKMNCFETKRMCFTASNSTSYLSGRYHRISAERDRYLRRYHETKDNKHYKKFVKLRKVASLLAKNDKKNHLTNQIYNSKSNPKKLWNVLGKFFKADSSKPSYFLIDGQEVIDGEIISNCFQKYFSQVINNLLSSMNTGSSISIDDILAIDNGNPNKFIFSPIYSWDVIRAFSYFRPSSVDHDFISHKVFLFCPNFFASKLCNIFNVSIKNNLFPTDLKVAKVVPIFKKGNTSLIENYRPISILPTVSKVFEKLIFEQMSHYVISNRFLNACQFGFQRGNSTESAFIYLLSIIFESFYHNHFCVIILLDYSKAFDSISHNKLCYKLKTQYNFSNPAISYIYSYLKNRLQYVSFGQHKSSYSHIYHGVPQGSLLGPLLFLLFINDLPSMLSHSCSRVVLYADDTALVVSDPDPHCLIEKTNEELNNVANYCRENSLFINSKKTYGIIFNNRSAFNFKNKFINKNSLTALVNKKITLVTASIIISLLPLTLTAFYFSSHPVTTCFSRAFHYLPRHSLVMLFNSIELFYIFYSKFILITSNRSSFRRI